MSEALVLERENKLLREEISLLKETIFQLRQSVIEPSWQVPVDLNLTAGEQRVLRIIYDSRCSISQHRIFDLLYPTFDCDNPPEAKIIQVFICRMRPKLKKHGIEIKTTKGQGYSLYEDSRKRLQDFVNLV